MRLLILAIFTLFSCCTVSTQLIPVFGNYYNLGSCPCSYFNLPWKFPPGITNSGVVQNFTVGYSSPIENMTLDIYYDSLLNSSLLNQDATPFPAGYTLFQGITFLYPLYTYVRGFYVYFSNTANLTANTISFPLIGTNSTTYGLLYWSTVFGQYSWLPGTLANNMLTVPWIFYNGIYSIVSYDSTNYLNQYKLFGQEFILNQYLYTYNFPNGFALQASVQSPVIIVIYFNTSNPTNMMPANYTSFNQYVDINAYGIVVGLNATVTFTYTTYESNFVIGYFDEVNLAWNFPNSGLNIDTTDHGVNQFTTHFSTWGLYGEPSNPNAGAILTPISLLWLLLVFVL